MEKKRRRIYGDGSMCEEERKFQEDLFGEESQESGGASSSANGQSAESQVKQQNERPQEKLESLLKQSRERDDSVNVEEREDNQGKRRR
eukprot:316713-Karenia_brevis.AAC.1